MTNTFLDRLREEPENIEKTSVGATVPLAHVEAVKASGLSSASLIRAAFAQAYDELQSEQK